MKEFLEQAEAVLFDFDGVLVDSEPIYYQSYNMVFEKRGHSIKEEEYWEYWSSKGEGIAGEARRYGLSISQDEIDVMYAERCSNYTAFCQQGAVPFYPGMLEALCELVEKGMPCAVASSSFEKDILTVFEKAGHYPPPCKVVGRGKGLRPKPHPDLFIYAAGRLNAAPGKCLVIEDAHKGLDAALAANMSCLILKNERNRNLDYPKATGIVENHEAFAAGVRAWKGN